MTVNSEQFQCYAPQQTSSLLHAYDGLLISSVQNIPVLFRPLLRAAICYSFTHKLIVMLAKMQQSSHCRSCLLYIALSTDMCIVA